MTTPTTQPEPDVKDWTWVLADVCGECGYNASMSPGHASAPVIRDAAIRWTALLLRDDVRLRPAPDVWSSLEYGCHTRDVFIRFNERLTVMLTQDNPTFENWDQDATALDERYWEQDPATVTRELADSASRLALTLDSVRDGEWARTGQRSNGASFTVDSLARYMTHDVVHHLVDVNG